MTLDGMYYLPHTAGQQAAKRATMRHNMDLAPTSRLGLAYATVLANGLISCALAVEHIDIVSMATLPGMHDSQSAAVPALRSL
jgi:hypothetical protein